MSHIFAGILGAVAMSATFGAVQLASGSNLAGSPATIAADAQSIWSIAQSRPIAPPASTQTASTRTISLKLSGLEDTSVLVRIPARVEAKKASANTPRLTPAQSRRAANFACEPMVSVLTDVAKVLAPGRCIS